MLYVEDALLLLAAHVERTKGFHGHLSEWHQNFIKNVSARIRAQNPLSTEQSRIIIKMLSKVKDRLIAAGEVSEPAIIALLSEPMHRQTPFQSANIPREVRHLGGNFLGFRFKFDDVIMAEFRSMRPEAWFDTQSRLWIVVVTRDTLAIIWKIIRNHRFSFDRETDVYLARAEDARDQASTFRLDASDQIIADVRDNDVLTAWVQLIAGGAHA